MPSSYSSNLRFELIGTGEQAGTWGTTTNTNVGTLIEAAIAGAVSVSVTSANQALTAASGSADQSRAAMIRLTTTTTLPFAVYAPPVPKLYVISNESAYQATIYNSTALGNTTAAGAGVIVPAGKSIAVWSTGTAFYPQTTFFDILPLTSGGTGASTASGARTNLGLGTLATQNSNSVSITGGAISGITDLAVADGGTGASTAANARTNLGLASGSYSAGLTVVSGTITTLTNFPTVRYIRVGDEVHVMGQTTVSVTSGGSNSFRTTLPVSSNLLSPSDVSGVVTCAHSTAYGGYTAVDTVNDQVIIVFSSSTGFALDYVIWSFIYKVQ